MVPQFFAFLSAAISFEGGYIQSIAPHQTLQLTLGTGTVDMERSNLLGIPRSWKRRNMLNKIPGSIYLVSGDSVVIQKLLSRKSAEQLTSRISHLCIELRSIHRERFKQALIKTGILWKTGSVISLGHHGFRFREDNSERRGTFHKALSC